jgi:cytochrome c peroxidase
MNNRNYGIIAGALVLGFVFQYAVNASHVVANTRFNPNVDESVGVLHQQQWQALGQKVFFDTALSTPQGQSCGSCHNPASAYADPGKVTTPGANPSLSANRNVPSITYSAYTPDWYYNSDDETWVGGFFADGRSLTMEHQAIEPLFNPLEMGVKDSQELAIKLRHSSYANQFENVFDARVWQNPELIAYAVSKALVAFQKSQQFANRFSSKYDAFLRAEVQLSADEKRGLALFEDEQKGNCAACHPNQVGPQGQWPLFTDFSYDNLGVPTNPNLAFLMLEKSHNPDGTDYADPGLASNPNIRDPKAQLGKFKVPSLRNVAITAPYMHNGFFDDLRESVEFYNNRDNSDKWSTPEIAENVNRDELGDLKLTEQEIDDIVAFLHTLTDNWRPTEN